MRILIITISIISIIFGCAPQKSNQEFTYLEIYRSNRIDTCIWYLSDNYITETDSLYDLSGIEFRNNEKDSIGYSLPKIKDFFEEDVDYYRLSDTLEIEFEGEDFIVLRYESGYSVDDGLIFTYFEPSIGILIIKSVSWGTYSRLINTGNTNLDKKVFFLNERIISNNKFFNHPK